MVRQNGMTKVTQKLLKKFFESRMINSFINKIKGDGQ
jgi:hypothetical protein